MMEDGFDSRNMKKETKIRSEGRNGTIGYDSGAKNVIVKVSKEEGE